MKDLIDLVQIVPKFKLRGADPLPDAKKEHSKLQEFYELVAGGKLKSDEDAALLLYNDDKQAPAYQKLRKSLKDRLLNALFVTDLRQSSYTDRQKAYYECYKEWAATKILFGKNARNAALGLALKVFKVSRRYEFTELNVDICHTLRLHYGTIEGDYARYQKYTEELQYFEGLWLAENRAEQYYIDISIRYAQHKSAKTDNQVDAKRYFSMLGDLLLQFDSYQLHFCARLLEASIYSSINDYESLLGVCDRAISFFEKKEYTAKVPLQVFLYQKAICNIQLGALDEGARLLGESLRYSEEGAFNWFKSHELAIMVMLRQRRYESAQETLDLVFAHPNFENLPENAKAVWKTSEAYLSFLAQIGKLPPAGKRTFRLSRFVNDIQVFSKDKQGINLHLVAIEILFLLAGGQKAALIERTEAIDKYRLRYLQDNEVKRSNYFFKLLLQVPKCGFRKADILKKTAQDLEALQATPIQTAYQSLEIEILPYDNIWEYVLELLD